MIGLLPEQPSGWPVSCLDCGSWSFMYISDRSGNYRLYNCKKCQKRYLAGWKGKPITSVFNEPKNTKLEDWLWVEVLEDVDDAIDVEFEIVTEEFRDGSPAMRVPVTRSLT